jgi:hypothetical protein
MKSTDNPQSSTRVSRFSKISQKHGLIVVVLLLGSFLLEPVNPLLGGIVAVAFFVALLFAFISGHMRSDELERLVQLKAAAISFIFIMFITFVLSILSSLNYTGLEYLQGSLFGIGFLLHLFLLPMVAKRTYEK